MAEIPGKNDGALDFGNAPEAFAKALSLKVGLERSRYSIGSARFSREPLPPNTKVAPFGWPATERDVYDARSGFRIGARLGKRQVVSFDVREPDATGGRGYRLRIGPIPPGWDPKQGGAQVSHAGPIDKYTLARVPLGIDGKPEPGTSWDVRYVGERWEDYCVGVGASLVLPRVRAEGELAADPSTRPNPLDFREVNPRDPALTRLLIEPQSLITRAETFQI